MESNEFINRHSELALLEECKNKRGLLVFYGRRRVGKTRLLTSWIRKNNFHYTQAIEGEPSLQIRQIYEDLKNHLEFAAEPKNWTDFFNLLETVDGLKVLCLDEFPYLVTSDPSLPSILQKWLDHQNKKKILLVLSGSSQAMMHSLFLNGSSPLYGRTLNCVHIKPMRYGHFCKYSHKPQDEMDMFENFSMVGGIPRYWELFPSLTDYVKNAEKLFFNFSPFMENEPKRLLQDEKVNGYVPWSVLEAIGRGSSKPSEIASRLEIPQTQLSKTLQLLVDTSLVKKTVPFGENHRSSKKSIYEITDPSLRFWFYVYSPLRTKWFEMTTKEKKLFIHNHASIVFEECCREIFPNASKYWEKNLELDIVSLSHDDKLTVGEVKYTVLSSAKRKQIEVELKEKWARSKLSQIYKNVTFKVLDFKDVCNML